MGNNLSFHEFEMDDSDSEIILIGHISTPPISNTLGDVLDYIGENRSLSPVMPTTMPVIRKRPDLSIFRHTSMYREIKSMCGMPANSRRPNERWSLMHELMRRESGFGQFSHNQQRFIQNFYLPNEKEERLMSLDYTKIYICSFTKDGSKLLTASNDAVIRIFDSSKGNYHRTNRIKAKDVNYCILDMDSSPCGKYFAYSTWSEYINVVGMDGSLETGQTYCLNTEPNRCGIFSVRFSPDNKTLLAGRNGGYVYLFDRETKRVKTVLTERDCDVDINAVSYVSDQNSNVFVTGCDNGVLKIWDTRTFSNRVRGVQQSVGTLLGHFDGITYIDPRNDGVYVLTNSKDQSIKVWDLRKTTPNSTVKARRTHNLPCPSWDYRWDSVPREYYNPASAMDGDVSVMTYRGHRVTRSLLRAKFSPLLQTGQRYIYTGCGTGRIIIYDVLTGCIKEAIEGHVDIVRDLGWHPVRAEIVSSSFDSHVNLNVFKRNKLLKQTNTERRARPLRRSRRIATQNGELDDDEDDNMNGRRW